MCGQGGLCSSGQGGYVVVYNTRIVKISSTTYICILIKITQPHVTVLDNLVVSYLVCSRDQPCTINVSVNIKPNLR